MTKSAGPGISRWAVLVLVGLVMAANYYVYDALSSIKSVMQTQLGFTSMDYGLIVSFYSFPNTWLFMAIFGGIILDKWGIRKTGFLFVAFCVVGTFLTAYGASDIFINGGPGYSLFGSFLKDYSPELKMMMLGRLLFGLGAETSIVVINKILVKWFKGKELALAFAINVSVARLGTAAALIMSPQLVTAATGWTTAIWTAAILMGIGLVFFVIYMYYDKKSDEVGQKVELMAADEEFHIRDIYNLITNRSFIFICLLCVAFYSAVFPFQAFCPDLLHNKFGLSLDWSGTLSSMIIWGTIIFTPIFGWYVDNKGKRATLMLIGSFLLIVTHLILALTYITPYVPMFILGIAFSLVPAALWPSVANIVEENKLGTAYGVLGSLQNLGLWGVPILVGYVLDKTNPGVTPELIEKGAASYDYTMTLLIFVALGVLGFLFAVLLKRNEAGKHSHGLELPAKNQ